MRITSATREILESLDEDLIFFGAEEDDTNSGTENDENSEEENESEEEEESGSEESREATKGEDTAALRKALQEERAERKKLEKEKKTEERARQRKEQGDSVALKQAQEDMDAATKRVEKLAEGYRKTILDRAIEKAAATLKFRDTEDALLLVDRSAILVDQDEDDPSQVDVDADSVKRAVKALADKKKHLLLTGTEDGEPTGSQFGNRNNSKKKSTEEEYRNKYSAL